MVREKITRQEVHALGDLVERVMADASFSEVDQHEQEQLDLVIALLNKLEFSLGE